MIRYTYIDINVKGGMHRALSIFLAKYETYAISFYKSSLWGGGYLFLK